MFKIIRSIIFLVLLITLVLFFDHKQDLLSDSPVGSLPPLGRFFDPFHGLWKNADAQDSDNHLDISMKGLRRPVNVIYDQLRIPHVFAANEPDLYFTQGYLTAKDRLWQMEFQTLAAAGRLSEIIGKKALAYDRYQRRLGMVYGAQKSLEVMMKDPVSRQVLISYTGGINAWIDQLKPSDFPLEYKILDYNPERWTPLKCMLLLKSMAATLSAESDAASMSANLHKFGKNVIADLFPDYPYMESPVIPSGTKWDFKALKIETAPSQSFLQLTRLKNGMAKNASEDAGEGAEPHTAEGAAQDAAKGAAQNAVKVAEQDAGEGAAQDAAAIGSNNWALSGSRTANGKTLLANDPHLTLSLPSLWYVVQLQAPGINVEGASLPGAPGVIIGFNEHISWGVTNVGAGVFDIYRMHWKDNSHGAYLFNGSWRNTRRQAEEIKIRGKASFMDTVIYTHQGPIVQDLSFPSKDGSGSMIPEGMAVHWSAHEGFNEIKAFYHINKASGYTEFVRGLEDFGSPGQNFAYADDQKNIALWVNGKFPLKYQEEGKYILDGSLGANDWKGWIPHDEVPHVLNPSRGFVSSANQSSTDLSYPYYLNWRFGVPFRGERINSLLSTMRKANTDSLKNMQSDIFNIYASQVLPLLLSQVSSKSRFDKLQLKALGILKKWNLRNEALEPAPAIFDKWVTYLEHDIWDEFDSTSLMRPNRDRTLKLLITEPTSKWFDLKSTKAIETRADIIALSFKRAVDSLKKTSGNNPAKWKWFEVKGTSVMHLLRIDAFSRLKIKNGGGSGIINASTHRTGPSWRMVVQPGFKPIAFGVYPGGQSGNPGSYWYDNFLDAWSEGKSFPLIFWHNAAENKQINLNTLNLKPSNR